MRYFVFCFLTSIFLFSGTGWTIPFLTTEGGLKFTDPHNKFYWFKLGGRLHLDETQFMGNTQNKAKDYPSGGIIRRAFVECSGGVGKDFDYRLWISYLGDNILLYNVFLRYAGFAENSFLTVGQFLPLSGLEDIGSNNDIMFLEESLASTTFSVPEKALGIKWNIALLDLFTFAATIYGPQQGSDNYNNIKRSDRLGEAFRITIAPIHTKTNVIHFGLFARYQAMQHTFQGQQLLQNNLFSTAPEALARNTARLVNAGNLRAKSYNHIVLEAALIEGPLTLQSEYHQVTVQRVPKIESDDVGNVTFRGLHIEGGYILTGESREYFFSDGMIGSVNPTGCFGAWELIARYSRVNLIDKNIYGGREHNVSLGLNWFINAHVRIVANYIRANIQPTNRNQPGIAPFDSAKRHLNIFAMRFQVVF